jgi:hypothetical protein
MIGPEGHDGTVVTTGRMCENCGFPDDELVLVRRVYVVPASWDRESSETIVPDPEWWCISCCSQYPNDPVVE